MKTTPSGVHSRCVELSELGVEFLMAATPSNLSSFDPEPLGIPLSPLAFLTPAWAHDDLLRLWNQMDAYAFGPREMPMPNWVLVDHALMASGLLIAACPRQALAGILTHFGVEESQRGILDLVLADIDALGYTGPVPIAGYCAAPTARSGRWMGWSMCSAIPRAGLGFTAKALALEAYRAAEVTGVTQWDNLSLRSHVRFGPARVEAAVVDLHTAAGSFVYSSDIAAWRRGLSTDAESDPSELVGARDRTRHLELQALIRTGAAQVEIVAPGLITSGDGSSVPVHIIPATGGGADV